jgi:Fe-S-cluster-containing hydrogenase component 2
MGYHPAKYSGEGCTGCGVCFYTCPEPGAITVFKKWAEVNMEAFCPHCDKTTKVFEDQVISGVLYCTECLNTVDESVDKVSIN